MIHVEPDPDPDALADIDLWGTCDNFTRERTPRADRGQALAP